MDVFSVTFASLGGARKHALKGKCEGGPAWTESTPAGRGETAAKARTPPLVAAPTPAAECKHKCKDKASCAHLCCNRWAATKKRPAAMEEKAAPKEMKEGGEGDDRPVTVYGKVVEEVEEIKYLGRKLTVGMGGKMTDKGVRYPKNETVLAAATRAQGKPYVRIRKAVEKRQLVWWGGILRLGEGSLVRKWLLGTRRGRVKRGCKTGGYLVPRLKKRMEAVGLGMENRWERRRWTAAGEAAATSSSEEEDGNGGGGGEEMEE